LSPILGHFSLEPWTTDRQNRSPKDEAGGLRVIAFTVDHGAAIKPAYGDRIKYNDRSAVVLGDTRCNENVVKFSTAD
jgi:ribonuclease BN (tRNA processing enzyme)